MQKEVDDALVFAPKYSAEKSTAESTNSSIVTFDQTTATATFETLTTTTQSTSSTTMYENEYNHEYNAVT